MPPCSRHRPPRRTEAEPDRFGPRRTGSGAGGTWPAALPRRPGMALALPSGVTSFEAMTTLGKPVRALLEDRFSIERPEVVRAQESADGSRKWLIRMADGQEIETVHIPEEDRGALCVSSQVGCTLTCRFCHTGTSRWFAIWGRWRSCRKSSPPAMRWANAAAWHQPER